MIIIDHFFHLFTHFSTRRLSMSNSVEVGFVTIENTNGKYILKSRIYSGRLVCDESNCPAVAELFRIACAGGEGIRISTRIALEIIVPSDTDVIINADDSIFVKCLNQSDDILKGVTVKTKDADSVIVQPSWDPDVAMTYDVAAYEDFVGAMKVIFMLIEN